MSGLLSVHILPLFSNDLLMASAEVVVGESTSPPTSSSSSASSPSSEEEEDEEDMAPALAAEASFIFGPGPSPSSPPSSFSSSAMLPRGAVLSPTSAYFVMDLSSIAAAAGVSSESMSMFMLTAYKTNNRCKKNPTYPS